MSPDDLDLLYETSDFTSKILKQGAKPGDTVMVRDLTGKLLTSVLGSIPTERLRRHKQLGSVSFYATIHI